MFVMFYKEYEKKWECVGHCFTLVVNFVKGLGLKVKSGRHLKQIIPKTKIFFLKMIFS